jgi:sirohydrochlorin ferrochelatase
MPGRFIIAHGSRRAASNDEVRALADAVRAQPGQACAHVETAFPELAEPSIAAGLAALAPRGATGIAAFPTFLLPVPTWRRTSPKPSPSSARHIPRSRCG